VKVSEQGSVSVESAKGLDENAVVGLTKDGEAIYCRCKGAEVQIDGKKLQLSGRDRYKLPSQGQAEYALTLVHDGNSQSIPLAGSKVFIQSLAASSSASTSAGEMAWNNVKNSTDPNALRKFVSDFPNSSFAGLARARVEDLSWEKARNSGQIADVQQFLNEFPNGQHASEAKARLSNLNNAQLALAQKDAETARLKAEKDAAARKQAEDATARKQAEDAAARKQAEDAAARKQAEDAATRKQAEDAQAQKLAQQDRQDIKQTLESYRSAYERKDLKTLMAVWPSVPASKFKTTFSAADKITVTLDESEPVIAGETATVSCGQTLQFVAGGKKTSLPTDSRRFTLRKVQGRWIIEKDN
jgi:outer membrane protein assembly factor BamD (BamD/ComL family)